MIVAGSADNFLRPALVSGRAEVGTLTAFFGVVGGLAAFGMIGLFLGPVLLALVLALLEFAEEGGEEPAPARADRIERSDIGRRTRVLAGPRGGRFGLRPRLAPCRGS